MRTVIAMLCSALLINAATLYAAEEAPTETPAPDLSEDQTAEEMLAAEAALEAQETAAASDEGEGDATDDPGGAGAPETDEPAPGLADEDFVPTIQISEDLSVSFPVDI